MDQDDVEFEQLLGEIPRATSAPPQVDDHHKPPSSGLFLSSSDGHKAFASRYGADHGGNVRFSSENKLMYGLGQQQEHDQDLACAFGGLSLSSREPPGAIHVPAAMGAPKSDWVCANGHSFPDQTPLSLGQEFPLEANGHLPSPKPSKGARISRSSLDHPYSGSLPNNHLSINQSSQCFVHSGSLFPNGLESGSNLNANVSKQLDWSPFPGPYENLRYSQALQEQVSMQRRVREEQIQAQIYANLQSHGSVSGFSVMPVSRVHSPLSAMQPSLFQPCAPLGDHNQQVLFKQQLLQLQQFNWGAFHHPQVLQTPSTPETYHLPHAGGLCCSNQSHCSLGESCSSGLAHSEAALRNCDTHQLHGAKVLPQFSYGNQFQATTPGARSKALSSRPKPGSMISEGELFYANHQLKDSLHSNNMLSVMYSKSQSLGQVDLEAESARHLSAGHLQQQPKYSNLEEVKGQIYAIAKDQHGCRFLQRKFDEGSVEDIKTIFSEIFDHIVELMTDPFGNYLIQKLLEVCTESQRMQFLLAVTQKAELVSISLNMHGTRAVQKLIETLTTPEQVDIVIRSLQQGVVSLIKDLNGNHVVQRCLQHLSNKDSQFIFDAAASHCVEIATHRHGCCVLQRCVDYATGSQRDRLVSEIAANALVLSQDPYGNYVVQYILDLNILWASNEVMVRLGGNYPQLAMQKFSSNVVEKCLKLADEENKTGIIRELITSSSLGQLLHHEYANYVIQCALSVSKGALHTSLVEALRPHLPALRSSPYGKRILSRTNLKKMQFIRA